MESIYSRLLLSDIGSVLQLHKGNPYLLLGTARNQPGVPDQCPACMFYQMSSSFSQSDYLCIWFTSADGVELRQTRMQHTVALPHRALGEIEEDTPLTMT